MEVQQYKVVVCGGSASSKTSFVRRFISGDFEKEHFPTLGVEVHPISFYTGDGTIQFNTWDCSGTDGWKGLDDGYYIKLDGAIIFVDDGDEWKEYIRKILLVNENATIVLVRNKIDLETEGGWDWQEVKQHEISSNFKVYEISAKSNYNIEKPFLFIARSFFNDEGLTFHEAPAVPEEPVEHEALKKFEKEIQGVV